jgi:putative PIN family toxin of toxin-antitoxin system
MRIVLDTNILVRANAKASGPARELLILIVNSPEHVLVMSPFLLRELERVFDYGRVRASTKLTDLEVAEYLSYIQATHVSDIVFPGPAPRVVPSDVDDDPVVHTAVVGRADILCTLNRDLYHPSVLEYCRERGVLVASDIAVLDLLRRR